MSGSTRSVCPWTQEPSLPLWSHLDPGPFSFDGDDVGALLLHGLTGAPTELRGLGEHLSARGYTVRAPLLPGHGTHHAALAQTTRQEWLRAAQDEFRALLGRVRRVFVVGLSMGGLLALQLGADVEDDDPRIGGIVALAPALRVTRLAHLTRLPLPVRFLPKAEERRPDLVDKAQLREVWSYTHTPLAAVREVLALQRDVDRALPRVTHPRLVMQGLRDRTVRPAGARRVHDRVGARDKELVWLARSGHIVSVDAERDVVFARVEAFIRARAQPP